MHHPIIIIGSGLAGYECAKEFRKLDQSTPLCIITAGDGHYYSKPLLSTALTQGKNPENLVVASAPAMAERLHATIMTKTRVDTVESTEHCVYADGEKLHYSRLVLACGANVITPPILGDDTGAIQSVNDLEDYARFRETLQNKKQIAILGAGLVGCEFANDLLNGGYEVDIIAPANYPLDSLLPEPVGLVLQAALAESGARWHLGQLVTEMETAAGGHRLFLSSKREIKTDRILSAIGLQPRIDLAEKAGIKIGRGIVVDNHLQTSAKDVFALGDCAEVNGLVLLFIAPLLHCARALAKTLAGEKTPVVYPAMPVAIKTPSCPIVVSPPPRGVDGVWEITGADKNLKALFYDKQHHLLGFALTGKAVSEKLTLTKQLPSLFN